MDARTFRARQRARRPVAYVTAEGRTLWFPAQVPTRVVVDLVERIEAGPAMVPVSQHVGVLRDLLPANQADADDWTLRDNPPEPYRTFDQLIDSGDLPSDELTSLTQALYGAYVLGLQGDIDQEEDSGDAGPPVLAGAESGV